MANTNSWNLSTRRDFLRRTSIVALTALPFTGLLFERAASSESSAAIFREADKLTGKTVEALNFALMLKYLKDDFYRQALANAKLISGTPRGIFEQISKHETDCVTWLILFLGDRSEAKPKFDFTGGGAFGDVFSNFQTFLALSQTFNETAVRGIKGQFANFESDSKVSGTMLKIHSITTRNAGIIRRMREIDTFIFEQPKRQGFLNNWRQFIYRNQDNKKLFKEDFNFVSVVPNSPILDEPLTKTQVLAITDLFTEYN